MHYLCPACGHRDEVSVPVGGTDADCGGCGRPLRLTREHRLAPPSVEQAGAWLVLISVFVVVSLVIGALVPPALCLLVPGGLVVWGFLTDQARKHVGVGAAIVVTELLGVDDNAYQLPLEPTGRVHVEGPRRVHEVSSVRFQRLSFPGQETWADLSRPANEILASRVLAAKRRIEAAVKAHVAQEGPYARDVFEFRKEGDFTGTAVVEDRGDGMHAFVLGIDFRPGKAPMPPSSEHLQRRRRETWRLRIGLATVLVLFPATNLLRQAVATDDDAVLAALQTCAAVTQELGTPLERVPWAMSCSHGDHGSVQADRTITIRGPHGRATGWYHARHRGDDQWLVELAVIDLPSGKVVGLGENYVDNPDQRGLESLFTPDDAVSCGHVEARGPRPRR